MEPASLKTAVRVPVCETPNPEAPEPHSEFIQATEEEMLAFLPVVEEAFRAANEAAFETAVIDFLASGGTFEGVELEHDDHAPRTHSEAMESYRTAEPEEGGLCPECGEGLLFLPEVEGCNCPYVAPCSACTSNPLTCNVCHWEDEK